MKKILQLIKQRSITRKLLVSFLSILIIPVVILAIFAYQSASSSLDRQMMGSALENVQQLNEIINTSIGEKENSADYFSEWLTKEKYNAKSNASIAEKFSQYISINKENPFIQVTQKGTLPAIRIFRCQAAIIRLNATGTKKRLQIKGKS